MGPSSWMTNPSQVFIGPSSGSVKAKEVASTAQERPEFQSPRRLLRVPSPGSPGSPGLPRGTWWTSSTNRGRNGFSPRFRTVKVSVVWWKPKLAGSDFLQCPSFAPVVGGALTFLAPSVCHQLLESSEICITEDFRTFGARFCSCCLPGRPWSVGCAPGPRPCL